MYSLADPGRSARSLARPDQQSVPEWPRKVGDLFGWVSRLFLEVRPEHAHPLAVGERRRAGEALVHDARERVHVGLGRHLLAMDLLGRHVVERAEGLPGPGQQAALAVLGEAEIRQVGVAVRVDQDVGRLDVAVEEALGVERVERARNLLEPAQRVRRGERALALEAVGERAAVDEALDEVGNPLATRPCRAPAPGADARLAGRCSPRARSAAGTSRRALCPPSPA